MFSHLKIFLSKLSLRNNIGTGTFGRVFLVRETRANLYFALKMMKKSDIVHLRQVEHVNAEREILSELQCPFVVRL